MNLKTLIDGLENERQPDDLTPQQIHFRTYQDSARNPEIWYLLWDLCHYYRMKPQSLLRYLIIEAHANLFGTSAKADD